MASSAFPPLRESSRVSPHSQSVEKQLPRQCLKDILCQDGFHLCVKPCSPEGARCLLRRSYVG